MLTGVVPFPEEFAERYRAAGYWRDRSLAEEWRDACRRFAHRIAVIDGDLAVTYGELDARASALALTLLDLGVKPLDRLIVQLPNRIEFAYLYLAMQKIGAIPVLALPAHRYLEMNQFAQIADAVGCVTPDRHREFDFREMVTKVRAANPRLTINIVLGEASEGFHAFADLLARTSTRDPAELDAIAIDPTDPAVFLLSGGTTGIPKLIPRAHNDYAYNSKMAASVCAIADESVLLDVLPISHNLPLACPGLQGFSFSGARTVLSTDTSPESVFRLIENHRVTHVHVVPALLIRWVNDPTIGSYDLSSLKVIQSGGQRLHPETRQRTKRLIPSVTVQENFGMAEGVLMFVRLDDPDEVRLETVGRPICPDDEIRILDEDDVVVPFGEVGEFCCRGPYTLRGYYGSPEHNAKAFTTDGFYRSGDLMRQHRTGNYIVEGRKKDLINRGGEKISAEEIENLILSHPSVQNVACVPVPDPDLGERMCACIIVRAGTTLTFDELLAFLETMEMARIKLPERLLLCDAFPLSNFGKVSKKQLSETAALHAIAPVRKTAPR